MLYTEIMGADTKTQWFAMRATYRREITAKEYLGGKGIEVYVPMTTVVKQIRGIKRKVTQPAISSLIFVCATKEQIQQAKQGVDYLQYITRKLEGRNIPIIIPDDQMERFVSIVQDDTIEKTFFAPGEVNFSQGTKVRVHGGAFDGYEGVYVKRRGKRKNEFMIDFEGVCSLSTVEVTPDLLEVLEK